LPQDAINPAHGSLLMMNSPSHGILSTQCLIRKMWKQEDSLFLRDKTLSFQDTTGINDL